MKRTFLFFAALALIFSACTNVEENNEFIVNGSVEGMETGIVSFGNFEEGEFESEYTTEIINGSFQIKGEIATPKIVYIQVDDINGYQALFLEPSEIEIDLKIQENEVAEMIVEGSSAQDRYDAYYEQYNSFRDKDQEIYENIYMPATENEDEEMMARADSLFEANEAARSDFMVNYIKENNADPVSAYLVVRNSYLFDLQQMEEFAQAFDKSLDSSEYVKSINDRIEILRRTAIGQPVIGFTQNDTAENPVQLNDVLGENYVLMDFWASWCVPCRNENPNVVAVYQDYKDKGFDVIGISLDTNKDKWIQAIEDDGLTWTHVSDLQGWRNTAANEYGVRSIPHSILVNPEGIIVGKNLRGEDLRNKVAELIEESRH